MIVPVPFSSMCLNSLIQLRLLGSVTCCASTWLGLGLGLGLWLGLALTLTLSQYLVEARGECGESLGGGGRHATLPRPDLAGVALRPILQRGG